MTPRSTFALSLAAFLLAPDVGRADDLAGAQVLFDEGRAMMKEGRYTEACPKFEESEKLDPGIGTKFQLANCWQQLGRTASAWAIFREVESEAHALGQFARERVAHDRAMALSPWLSKMAIVLEEPATAVEASIRRDGVVLGREQWEAPLPVDPGTHVVTAIAPRKQPWQTTVQVPPDGKVVTVDIPPLADLTDTTPRVADAPPAGRAESASAITARGPAPALSPAVLPARGVTAAMPPSLEETVAIIDRGSGQRSAGWLLVGTGVVSLAAGVYFTSQWIDDRSLSGDHCVGDTCDALGSKLRSDARAQGIAAAATLGGGAATFLIGSVLVATAPRPQLVLTPTQRGSRRRLFWGVAPIVGPREAGLGVSGGF